MKKVLAVDDDHDVLYTLEAIGGGDFHLVTVDNGFAALDLLKRGVSSGCCRLYMPEMNGMELWRRLGTRSADSILVLTVDESWI